MSWDELERQFDSLGYWRLCDEYSVVDAALLIAEENPASNNQREYIENWEKPPEAYIAARTALKNAVLSGTIKAILRYDARERGFDEYGDYESPQSGESFREQIQDGVPIGSGVIFKQEPNWLLTTIKRADILNWLSARGFKTGFFFPENSNVPDYLDSNNTFYAPKLAAAIRAWEAVSSSPNSLKGKTPKQSLEIWLRKNADKFGLTKEDGNPNEQGIEDISKIANWNTKGGAPQTPG